MAALRDVFEVYGALDEAAGKSSDPTTAATLDEFLPKASRNAGWYREVEDFFFREKAQQSPSLGDACARLGKRAEQAKPGEPPPLTAPQKQRLFYGLSAATRIHEVAPTSVLAGSKEDLKAAVLPGLAAVGPDNKPYKWRLDNVNRHFDAYSARVQSGSVGRANYVPFRAEAASSRMELVDPSTLDIPLCDSALVVVDGLRCAVIDTNLTSKRISLNELKAIVNPFNWNKNYPAFFLSMAPFRDPFRRDGWRRVLETVGFGELDSLDITTALKYHPTDRELEASLDYDLDDPTPGPGDGQVLVDRGYINMWATEGDPDVPGVRVRTRKVIHIDGLSPYAQTRWVCLTGYGTASSEFLFGPAENTPDKPEPFHYYKHGQQPEAAPETSDSGPSTHVVATAVDVWTDSVQDLVSDYFEVAEKWMAGGLRLSDVTELSQKVTGRLVSSPSEFLERINQPRYPRGRANDAQQGRQPNQTQQGDAP
jgi:hypothetical protein